MSVYPYRYGCNLLHNRTLHQQVCTSSTKEVSHPQHVQYWVSEDSCYGTLFWGKILDWEINCHCYSSKQKGQHGWTLVRSPELSVTNTAGCYEHLSNRDRKGFFAVVLFWWIKKLSEEKQRFHSGENKIFITKLKTERKTKWEKKNGRNSLKSVYSVVPILLKIIIWIIYCSLKEIVPVWPLSSDGAFVNSKNIDIVNYDLGTLT